MSCFSHRSRWFLQCRGREGIGHPPVSEDDSGVGDGRHGAGSFGALHIQQPDCALTGTPPQPYPSAVPLCSATEAISQYNTPAGPCLHSS